VFNKKTKIIFLGFIFLLLPVFVFADELGQETTFFVDSDFDALAREQASSTLRAISGSAYFYIDNSWWDKLNQEELEQVNAALQNLAREFETKIYPKLTKTFGSEWNPGIDKDTRITILIHSMKKTAGGYFSAADQYPRLQVSISNEREIVYLNSEYINNVLAKSFLAHELIHLITFNQKDKKFGISEEIWLNEARAEYAPTLLGYNDVYENSNLQMRVRDFREIPNDSLTEWKNSKDDYGALNLFIHYLVEHYGTDILADSLYCSKIGIESINYALSKNGFDQNFARIFTDWTIAVYLNDCGVSEKYCYLNPNLKNLRVTPQINFLPIIGKSSLFVNQTTKNWAGNWYKFVGGNKVLKLEFIGNPKATFKIPYIVQDIENNYSIDFLEFDSEQKAIIYVLDFHTKNTSLTIIPSVQKQVSDSAEDEFYSFSWVVSTVDRTPEQKEELIQNLLTQIEILKAEIAKIRAKINIILAQKQTKKIDACAFLPTKLKNNLYHGIENNSEVCLLQQLLKEQGKDIYSEGLVTGYFGPLTLAAVIRFQERYFTEILEPLGLKKGTGYVGPSTRAKLNKL
jgi:hypothetical protein